MKFTIRDLLWLTVVVALSVGWWLDRSALIRHYENTFENNITWMTKARFLEDALRHEGWKIDLEGKRLLASPPRDQRLLDPAPVQNTSSE
jgi:hypothetical protein